MAAVAERASPRVASPAEPGTIVDVEFLSRLQFAGTIMFHYLFPPLSIGLGLLLVVMEGFFLATRNPAWEAAARFWTKIFALNFAVGVATGIVMEFEFGTNWAAYSRFVGDVFGSALAAEGIFAFFLESGFLAVLVFGWDRVGPKTHFFATCMVALGSIFSAVWIVVANSWQQTPAGYRIVQYELMGKMQERAEITDFWAMVFNPSSMDRLSHTLIGAFVLGAFFVMSISAYYLLKGRHAHVAGRCFKTALVVGTISTLLAGATGHSSAVTVARTQPAKLAAMEGHFIQHGKGADLHVFGIPDPANQTVHLPIKLPCMLSFLIYGDLDRPVTALEEIPEDERPPVHIPFFTFHLMVGLGTLMIVLCVTAAGFWIAGRLERQRWLLWIFVFAVVAPYLANQAGWVTAEVGRQPWIVYPSVQNGVAMRGLKTSEGLSESVKAEQVLSSILAFSAIYAMLFGLWVFVLTTKIMHGPEEPEPAEKRIARQGRGGLFRVAGDKTDPSRGSLLTASLKAGENDAGPGGSEEPEASAKEDRR